MLYNILENTEIKSTVILHQGQFLLTNLVQFLIKCKCF